MCICTSISIFPYFLHISYNNIHMSIYRTSWNTTEHTWKINGLSFFVHMCIWMRIGAPTNTRPPGELPARLGGYPWPWRLLTAKLHTGMVR